MAIDKRKREIVYVEGREPTGKERFDLRKGTIESLYGAANKVLHADLEGYLTRQRNLVLPVWFEENPIYIEWKVHHDRRLIGIENYDENVKPVSIDICPRKFVYSQIRRPQNLGFVAMDRESKSVLDKLHESFGDQHFNRELLNKGLYIFNQ